MKNDDHTFVIVTISACFVLLSIVYTIAAHDPSIDWESISAIMVGVYLYFVYLIVSILYAGPRNPIRYFRSGMPQEKKQETYINEMYEH